VESQPAPEPSVQSAPEVGQLALAQSSPLSQSTSQSHDCAQSTAAHAGLAALPSQTTLQLPVPQITFAHALAPRHSISHDVACEQSTVPHALVAVQSTSHSKPAGQVMLLHPCGESQSMSHVISVKLHDVHGAGHGITSGGRLSTMQ
jgi:hypothetical protein